MRKRIHQTVNLWLFSLCTALALSSSNARAQTTTPNVTVEILGIGAESLIGGDMTDPENDGEDAVGSGTSPTWNWSEITASIEADFEGGENSFNIFDNKVGGGNDKWCCDDPTLDVPVWVAVQFPQQRSLTHFTVTSGNDTPDRDPTNWAIQGSNDGEAYTDIYRFVDLTVPWTDRNQVVKFTLPGPSQPYRYLRYIAFETPGTLHQLNEIEYFGSIGVGTDTDKDGMPDEYETRLGFNPNDATDAAKDFDGDGVTNLDEYTAGTDPIDVTKPTLVSTRTTSALNQVMLTFSEEIDPSTATNAANYVISPALAITNVTYKAKVVTLSTATQTAGGTNYTVTVSNVRDLSKNVVAAGTSGSFFSYQLTKNGVLKFSYYGNLDSTGSTVDILTSDPDYPGNPDLVTAVYSFNSRDAFPDDSHEQYGASMEGFLTPEKSGSYRFFVYSDDASQFSLSTDETPANLAMIAEETGCCNNFAEPSDSNLRTSIPVSLVANQRYYVRMLYKEGGGGDFGQVAWREEGDTTPAGSLTPIPGRFLSAEIDLPAPAEGGYIRRTPAPNATNVDPVGGLTIVHRDGLVPWTTNNVTLKIDGAPVTPTLLKQGNTLTITYKAAARFASESTHTVTVTAPNPAGVLADEQYSFKTILYNGVTKDVVTGVDALLIAAANYGANGSGATGATNDYAVNLATAGGYVQVLDASFLNPAAAKDELSVAIWVKKHDIAASSAFWISSPTQVRAFQAHVPWSDSTVYLDTAGTAAVCCDGTENRLSAGIDTFAGFTGDVAGGDISWWTNDWHFFVFTKKADFKQIWIDGTLFLEGNNTAVLQTNINSLLFGAEIGGVNRMHSLIDDYSFYSTALTQAQVTNLFNGTLPTALPAAAGLLGYWNFNDAPTNGGGGTGPSATFTLNTDSTLTIDVAGGGSVEATDALPGGWQTVGAAPQKVPLTGKARFFRIKR